MDLFKSMESLLKEIGGYLSFDFIVIASLLLMVAVIVVTILMTNNTYEVKLLRHITGLNKYFAKNPYVNDDNIVELNNKMKAVPKTVRYCWQEYMLNRDKAPSEYLNTIACVDQPCKSSSYENWTTTASVCTIIIAILSFLLGLARMAVDETIRFNTFLFEVLMMPILILIIGYFFVTFLRARHTSIMADAYYSFHEFERNINRACTTMPAYIDYEVLFTPKEIKEGIPALQDYLEKRALQEKKEREDAEMFASNLEYYDFDDLGVDNALLLERAMKECEKYINVKRELSSRVQSKEREMYNYQKNFDEVTKESERKSQASRETIAQLTEQINQTTVKIEANYMKKRLNEEQTKLQQLEKDYEIARTRYQKQQDEMGAEVDALNAEIAARKKETEDAMKAECQNYANKIYANVSKTVQDQSKPYVDQLSEDKARLEDTINELRLNISSTTDELNKVSTELTTKNEEYEQKIAELKALQELKTFLTSPEFRQSFLSRKEVREINGQNIEVSEDTVKQIADLQARLKLADENARLYQDKVRLLEKGLNIAHSEVSSTKRANTELTEKAKSATIAKREAETKLATTVVNPSDSKAEDKETTPKTSTVKDDKEKSEKKSTSDLEEKAPKKKESLDSLLSAVNKMKNDENNNK